jgi:predicted nucleic acid-binding protein
MDLAFLDTSALAKLYITEIGDTWLQSFVVGKEITVSQLALFEAITVIRRRHLEGEFTQEEAEDLVAKILVDSTSFRIIPLGGTDQLDKLAEEAFKLPSIFRLRALDGLQMVAALIVREAASAVTPADSVVFVSSDAQLLRIMQHLGFSTENPEDHP